METLCTHPIRYVADQTGLKSYLIRTWEDRYGVVRPHRTSGNRRLYSDDDIRRLKLLKRAVDCGHNISTVAGLDHKDLTALVERAAKDRPRQALQDPSEPGGSQLLAQTSAWPTIERALDSIVQLDAPGLESILSDAAVDLPRQTFVVDIVVPLFIRIGDLWRAGKLKTVSEHMASVTVRSILGDMLRTVEIAQDAPRIVVATPAGHRHEIGALTAALAAAESGWTPLYFGPNLPSDEIAYAVKKRSARALSLSLCHSLNASRLSVELGKIRRAVEPDLPIFVGGPGAAAAGAALEHIAAMVCDDLQAFRDRLEDLV